MTRNGEAGTRGPSIPRSWGNGSACFADINNLECEKRDQLLVHACLNFFCYFASQVSNGGSDDAVT